MSDSSVYGVCTAAPCPQAREGRCTKLRLGVTLLFMQLVSEASHRTQSQNTVTGLEFFFLFFLFFFF